MWLKVLVVVITLFVNIFSQTVQILKEEQRKVDVNTVIKDVENRVNKNVYNNTTCGGIFIQSQLLIESPNYPNNYPNNLSCLYVLRGPYCPVNYTLQFLDFILEDSLNCVKDKLQIERYDVFCGYKEGIETYFSKSGSLNLDFYTDDTSTQKGFRILISRSPCIQINETEMDENTTEENKYLPPDLSNNFTFDQNYKNMNICGGIFDSSQFLIETPNYPNGYKRNLNCLFIFKGPYCPLNYTFTILDFQIENSTNCINDRFEIKNKEILCGNQYGIKNYFTRNGILEMTLLTNRFRNGRGFRIIVNRSKCLENDNNTQIVPPVFSPRNGYSNDNEDVTSSQPGPPTISPIEDSYDPPDTKFFGDDPNDNRKGPYPPSGIKPEGGDQLYPGKTYDSNFGDYFPPNIQPNSKEPACCANTYSEKHFFLSSPGFPYSYNNPTECTFTIYKANPKVCRMRIHFYYFWIGEQNLDCNQGYLQIDGKLLCGCHTNLKLVSPFEQNFGNTKVIRFKNIGTPKESFMGFAMEVIQDECPKRYAPTDFSNGFHFYNDQFNKIAWPNSTHLETKSRLFDDNTEIFETFDLGYKPRIVKHVYFFESPDYNENVFNKRRDVEETNYFETTDLNTLYPRSDESKCRNWGTNQLNSLNTNRLWNNMARCTHIETSYGVSECKEYNFIKGYFQSPGYPYYYPKDLNICYRFIKQPGFCRLRLIILDFHIENSLECRKDYLQFNGRYRYCGNILLNTFTQFNFMNKNYEEIKFITDSQINGRGFRGIYEQIPCSENFAPTVPPTSTIGSLVPPPLPEIQRPTVLPILPTTVMPTEIPNNPNTPCIKFIQDEYFTIDIYNHGKTLCNFNVKKNNENICRLEISFVTFDFPCNLEYLIINDRRFCGKMSSRMMYFNYENKEEIRIVYNKISRLDTMGYGLKLHLVGRQITDGCQEVIPPAQRILSVSRRVSKDLTNQNEERSSDYNNEENNEDDNEMEFYTEENQTATFFRKESEDICGVVIYLKTFNLNESICNMLESEKDNCQEISENVAYVPYNNTTNKLELKFNNLNIMHDIEFKEVTCDNKFIV